MQINPHVQLQNGCDDWSHAIRTTLASILILHRPLPFARESQIDVQEYSGRRLLPEESNRMHIPGEEPQRISERTYYFDYNAALGWCWRADDGKLLNTDSLGELVLKQLLDLHRKVESGAVTRK